MQDNILSFIGLARRAGSAELGAEKVYEMASIGKAKMVLLADDISGNTVKAVNNTCAHKEIPVVKAGCSMDVLGPAVGFKQCGVITITDIGFAQSLAEKMGLSDVAELLKGKKAREKKRFEKKHGTQGKAASGKRR